MDLFSDKLVSLYTNTTTNEKISIFEICFKKNKKDSPI